MKRREVSEVQEIELEVSIPVLASITGCTYEVLEVLPDNILKVKFKVRGPLVHDIRIISPNSFSEYVFASYDGGGIKLIRRSDLEKCIIERLEELF